MYTAENVLEVLCDFADVADYSSSDMLPSCEKGLAFVKARLKPEVDENEPLILSTAAAMAHFYFFIVRLTEPEKYQSYKVGDVTFKQDPVKLYAFEKELRNQALADACHILRDCGFFCRAG